MDTGRPFEKASGRTLQSTERSSSLALLESTKGNDLLHTQSARQIAIRSLGGRPARVRSLLLLDAQFLDQIAGLFRSTKQVVSKGLSGHGHLILEDISFLRVFLEPG